jgi:hypothetical protein
MVGSLGRVAGRGGVDGRVTPAAGGDVAGGAATRWGLEPLWTVMQVIEDVVVATRRSSFVNQFLSTS